MSTHPTFTHRQFLGRVAAVSDTMHVEVVRSVRLDETLSEIKGRRFDCIKVKTDPFTGSDRQASDVLLTRPAAQKLRDLLTEALDATADDPTMWVRDAMEDGDLL